MWLISISTAKLTFSHNLSDCKSIQGVGVGHWGPHYDGIQYKPSPACTTGSISGTSGQARSSRLASSLRCGSGATIRFDTHCVQSIVLLSDFFKPEYSTNVIVEMLKFLRLKPKDLIRMLYGQTAIHFRFRGFLSTKCIVRVSVDWREKSTRCVLFYTSSKLVKTPNEINGIVDINTLPQRPPPPRCTRMGSSCFRRCSRGLRSRWTR